MRIFISPNLFKEKNYIQLLRVHKYHPINRTQRTIIKQNPKIVLVIKVNVGEILISFALAATTSFSKLSIFFLSKGSKSLPRVHVGGSSQARYPQVSSTLQQ